MYNLPDQLLVTNPIKRYLINSPMLPDLKLDPDGGLTIYIQIGSPGPDKEANWLPAPNGPFMLAMRYYLPIRSYCPVNGSRRLSKRQNKRNIRHRENLGNQQACADRGPQKQDLG